MRAGWSGSRARLRIGRIQTALLCRSLGITLLIALALLRDPLASVPLYLVRTWLMCATTTPPRVLAMAFGLASFCPGMRTLPSLDLSCNPSARRVQCARPLWARRNCTQGLSKSVLNDYVSKRNRAKWNSLESINNFSWSGASTARAQSYRTRALCVASCV